MRFRSGKYDHTSRCSVIITDYDLFDQWELYLGEWCKRLKHSEDSAHPCVSVRSFHSTKTLSTWKLLANYLKLLSLAWRGVLSIASQFDVSKAPWSARWSSLCTGASNWQSRQSWLWLCSLSTGTTRSWNVLTSWAMAIFSTLPPTTYHHLPPPPPNQLNQSPRLIFIWRTKQ